MERYLGYSNLATHILVTYVLILIIIIIFIVVIIIKIESAVQGRERVKTLYQSEDPNTTQHNQPTEGRK